MSSRSPLAGRARRRATGFAHAVEELLWRAIRSRQLGVTFRRQVLIGRYIVDFAAPSVRLVVAIDGSFHAGRKRPDARRDVALASAGHRVLRLEAQLVLSAPPLAVARIRVAP